VDQVIGKSLPHRGRLSSDPDQHEPYEEMRHFRDLIENEPSHRARLGDSLYEAFFTMSRWTAQQADVAKP
jgi:hypothetical protein